MACHLCNKPYDPGVKLPHQCKIEETICSDCSGRYSIICLTRCYDQYCIAYSGTNSKEECHLIDVGSKTYCWNHVLITFTKDV